MAEREAGVGRSDDTRVIEDTSGVRLADKASFGMRFIPDMGVSHRATVDFGKHPA